MMSDDEEIDRLMGQIRQLAGAFGHGGVSGFFPTDYWTPAVNVYETDRGWVVCMAMGGVRRDRIDVQVRPGLLEIRGERLPPRPAGCEVDRMRILTMEIEHGPFERVIRIPERVDLENVTSSCREGMLWVSLPIAP